MACNDDLLRATGSPSLRAGESSGLGGAGNAVGGPTERGSKVGDAHRGLVLDWQLTATKSR
jgi:hypothetical protein